MVTHASPSVLHFLRRGERRDDGGRRGQIEQSHDMTLPSASISAAYRIDGFRIIWPHFYAA